MGNRRSDDKQTKRMGNGGKFNQCANCLKNERLCREPLLIFETWGSTVDRYCIAGFGNTRTPLSAQVHPPYAGPVHSGSWFGGRTEDASVRTPRW